MAEDKPLAEFQGRDVLAAKAKLTNTGDGLSTAMELDPVLLQHGDEVMVLCKARVVDIDTKPHTKGDLHGPLDFVYNLRAEAMMLTDTPQNRKLLDRQVGRIDQLKEIKGQRSIDEELEPGGLAPDDDGADPLEEGI